MQYAFVLIGVSDKRRIKEVLGNLRKLDQVVVARAVSGPYDIIVYLVAPDKNALGNCVVKNIRTIIPVSSTMTYLVTD